MKRKPSCSAWERAATGAAAALVFGFAGADAAVIAYNFSENPGNQVLDTTTPKGPTGTAIWNDSNDAANLAAGSEGNLVDDSGANSGASITWSSSNVWWNGSGTGSEDAKVAVGYLDDGGGGVSVTVDNIPYALYNVYGIVGSDQGDTYTTLDFVLNGSTWALGGGAAATATAYGNSFGGTSGNNAWVEVTTGQVGNYWKVDNLSGSTLTIQGTARNGAERGSLTAIIIEEVPEPATLTFGLLGLLPLLRRRRS